MATHRQGNAAAAWRDGIAIAAAALFAFVSVHFEWRDHRRNDAPARSISLTNCRGHCCSLALGLAWLRGAACAKRVRALRRQVRSKQNELSRSGRIVASTRQCKDQEDERKNLARELHDELGQYLNAIRWTPFACVTHVQSDPADAKRCASLIIGIVDRLQGRVHDVVRACARPGSTSSVSPRRSKTAWTDGGAACRR
jgi:glucose-6-phosphate-specific signal transduction histidine kinase